MSSRLSSCTFDCSRRFQIQISLLKVGEKLANLAREDLSESSRDIFVVGTVAQDQVWKLEKKHPGIGELSRILSRLDGSHRQNHQDPKFLLKIDVGVQLIDFSHRSGEENNGIQQAFVVSQVVDALFSEKGHCKCCMSTREKLCRCLVGNKRTLGSLMDLSGLENVPTVLAGLKSMFFDDLSDALGDIVNAVFVNEVFQQGTLTWKVHLRLIRERTGTHETFE